MAKSQRIRLSVTLRDGTVHSFEVAKLPRFWKSYVMQACPYGTDFYGAQFSREVVS